MIKPSIHSLNQNTPAMRSLMIRPAALQKHNLQKKLSQHINSFQSKTYQPKLIGELWMAATTSPGQKTNTFPNTVDRAGHRAPQAPLLIDLTLWIIWRTPPLSQSMLKLSWMHMQVVAAMAATQQKFMNGPIATAFLIALACSTLHITYKRHLLILMSVETAPGHHLLRETLVLRDVGPSHTASTT